MWPTREKRRCHSARSLVITATRLRVKQKAEHALPPAVSHPALTRVQPGMMLLAAMMPLAVHVGMPFFLSTCMLFADSMCALLCCVYADVQTESSEHPDCQHQEQPTRWAVFPLPVHAVEPAKHPDEASLCA